MATAGFLKFKIGDLLCAVAIARVREVLPMVELIRPPRGPRVLEGYLNLGGTAVPVLRLDRVLDLPERMVTAADHLILIRLGDRAVALLVERALELMRVEDREMIAGEFAKLSPCVAGEIRGPAGPVHVLDVDRLVLDVERRALDEFALEAQRRLVSPRGNVA